MTSLYRTLSFAEADSFVLAVAEDLNFDLGCRPWKDTLR